MHKLLLGGLVQGRFLLGCETVHLTGEHLLQSFTVLCNTFPHGIRKSGHEFRVLEVVVPFQPDQILHHLVERSEDINHRYTVPIILWNDLGQLASTDSELILPNSLIDPLQDTLICQTEPSPDELFQETLHVEREWRPIKPVSMVRP